MSDDMLWLSPNRLPSGREPRSWSMSPRSTPSRPPVGRRRPSATSAVIHGRPEDVVKRIRAGFDRRLDGYRTDQTYQLPVSSKLAAGRLS
jgi:hypothetical protein